MCLLGGFLETFKLQDLSGAFLFLTAFIKQNKVSQAESDLTCYIFTLNKYISILGVNDM